MASVKKREDGKWRARYRDAAGKEHAKHFARKTDADKWLATQTAAVVAGTWIDPRQGRVTVREYAEQWAASQVWRPNTTVRVRSALNRHIYPALGPRPLASVRPTEVQAFVRQLQDSLSPGSVKAIYQVVQSVFRAAVLDRVITASPCVRITLPTREQKPLDIPSLDLLRKLAELLPADRRAVVFVGAGLGLRPGEMFALDLEDVDFLRRTVTVRRQLDDQRRFGPPKTPSSYRTIPLPHTVGVELSRHLAATGRAGATSGLLFCDENGGAVYRDTFENVWRKAAIKAKVPTLRLHDLRHAYASALINAGESVKVVQKRLGHASAVVTLNVYGHLWPDSDDKTRAAVDAFLAPSSDSSADSLRTGDA